MVKNAKNKREAAKELVRMYKEDVMRQYYYWSGLAARIGMELDGL